MLSSTLRRPAALGLFILLASVFFLASASAQRVPIAIGKGDEKKKEDELTDSFNVELNREASQKLDAIREYLGKPNKPWETICEVMQRLLQSSGDSFVEVERTDPKSKKSKKSKVSLKTEVNRMIGTFEKEGRQMYQLMYGAAAEEKLKRSIDLGDRQLLAEVAEQYLHTKAGGEAAVQLGTWHLDRGRYIMAALTFQKLQLRNADDPLSPQVLFKAATAYRRLGENEIADGYWKRMKEVLGNKTELVLGEKKFTLDQVESMYKKEVSVKSMYAQGEWTLGPGGNHTRNAVGKGDKAFMDPRFTFSMLPAFDKDEADKRKSSYEYIKQHIDQAMSQFENRQTVPLPMFFPIASNGKVIMRTYDGVYCVATRDDKGAEPPIAAGDVIWRWDCDYSLYNMIKDSGPKSNFDTQFKPFYTSQGPFGIWFENGLNGSLAHDGANAYFVDDIAVPPHPQYVAQFGFNGQPVMFGPFNDWVYANQLCAVNLETGKLMWKAGGKSAGPKNGGPVAETAATLLTDACFLGPPLPLGGKLYVMIEKEKELILCCIDPTKISRVDGKHVPELVWSQKLGSPMNDLWKDPMRRIQGLQLSYSDGMLVCPTNAGAILGIDLLSHSLVWAHSYRDASAQNPDLQPGGRIRPPIPQNPGYVNQDRWRVGTPMISQGKVVFTAYDSGSIQCLDLRTGELLWKSARAPEDLYVAGIFGDRVMVVGKNAVRFLKLDTKEIAGERIGRDIVTGMPSGVGTSNGTQYFLPIRSSPDTREPEIWTIGIAQGTIDAKTKSRKKIVPGNLLFFEGDVYSQTALSLIAFPQLQIKIDEMNKRLAQNPNDPIGLAEKGDLLLDDGKLREAIETLHKAQANNPTEVTQTFCKDKLYEAMTELLQRDFNTAEGFLDEYKTLCNFAIPANIDAQKAALLKDEQLRRESGRLVLLANGREKQGKLLEAFENYMAFGIIRESQELVDAIDEPGTKARPDVWARGRISNMIRNAKGDLQKKDLEDRISVEWNKIKDANDLDKFRRFVRLFGGMFATGNEARLLLAEKLMATNNEDELREAQGILLTLRHNEDRKTAAQATETLARLYIKKGLLEDAVYMFAELGRLFEKDVVRDGKTGADYYGELVSDKRFLPYLEPIRLNWSEKVKATETTGGAPVQPIASFTIEPDGELLPFFQRYRVFVEMNYQGTANWGLKVVDRITGEERFKSKPLPMATFMNFGFQNTAAMKFTYVRGHTLVMSINHEVFAFDLADKKELWKFDLFGKNRPANIYPNAQQDPDGGIRLFYPDGWSQRVGQVGVIESSYICLITRDGLVAINPADGKTLWTKSNVSARVQLAGDEEYIYIFEQNNDGSPCPTRVVRASDGVSVTGVPDSSGLFANPRKLKMFGRNLFVFEENGNQKAFRMVDLLTGKELWKKDLDPKAIVLRSDEPNLFGYITSTGDVAVFDARNGEQVFKSKLDEKKLAQHMEKVNEAVLLSDRDRFYIALNRPVVGNVNNYPAVNAGVRTVRVNGSLYCFAKSGKRLWFTDEQLENQTIIMEQFNDLPVLMAAYNYYNNNNFGGTYGTRIMAIEKATGKAKYRRDMPQQNQFHAIVTDPKSGTIEMWRYDLRIKFSPDEPKPTGALDKKEETASGGKTRTDLRTVTEVQNINGQLIPITRTVPVQVVEPLKK